MNIRRFIRLWVIVVLFAVTAVSFGLAVTGAGFIVWALMTVALQNPFVVGAVLATFVVAAILYFGTNIEGNE